jgi:hypothetical protein
MGYRSQVESIIYGDPERIDLFLVKHKMIGAEVNPFEEFKESIQVCDFEINVWDDKGDTAGKKKQKVIHLQGDDWKWYETYTDVMAWEALMVDAEGFGLMYEFVRVGEEDGDIERRVSDEDDGYLYADTNISCSLQIDRY